RERPLDLLVNNASVLLPARQLSADGIELTFATNVLGYFLLTELLRPNLLAAAAARVVNVTSGGLYTARLHLDDLQYATRPFNGTTAYAESKRAELVLTEQWATAWRGTGIAVHAVHPGWADTPGVQTSLPRFARLMRPLLRTPRQGADGIVWLCTTPDLARFPNGRLWFDRQPRPHHKLGMPRNTPAEIQQFWQICHDLTACSIS
ncbi:MAG: SDR family NAD(P)-dependent oxidoreductase, partial [Anaerolineales bacterium]|nr:SDR family NAD(P)-dependent oxidoreductase [Anaerolineales bacterium]